MQLQLNKPGLEKFIDQKVKSGDFDSASAVIEDALVRMMRDERTLTDSDVSAINQAEDEIDRGEFVDFDAFASEMRKMYGRR
jgi:putative addiction module CopG family antidote